MNRRPGSRSRAFVTIAMKIAPLERKEWIAAMIAELDHVPAAARWPFAVGCLFTAVKERAMSSHFLHSAAHSLLIGGAILWAAMNLRFAGRMSAHDATVLEAFGYLMALLFAGGALATARLGYRATLALAVPLIALLAGAAVFIRFGSGPAFSSSLYLALVVEDIAVLFLAVVIAAVALGSTTVRQEQ